MGDKVIKRTVFARVLYLIVCLLTWASLSSLAMAAQDYREYQLKAGFLSNFLRFISWPESVFNGIDSAMIICVVGENPFGSALDVVAKKKVGQRKVNVIYTHSPTDIPPCHLLYVSKSMAGNLDTIFSTTENRAIVTVSDVVGFAAMGGAIEFITKNNRLSFNINNSVLKQRNISARASMLNLAAVVY